MKKINASFVECLKLWWYGVKMEYYFTRTRDEIWLASRHPKRPIYFYKQIKQKLSIASKQYWNYYESLDKRRKK